MEWIDAALREVMLFAAIGFLVGGIDDATIDVLHVLRRLRQRWRGDHGATLADHRIAPDPPRMAVFVAAWDEAAVIGAMLRTALARFDYPDYRLYVGVYLNDPATVAIVTALADRDPRLRVVACPRPGPTTKADCLNTLWRALRHDEVAEQRPFAGVLLHDAEDVVHAGELRVTSAWLARADAVQLPVLPLIDAGARLVSGHYADEFAESHGKSLPVRQSLGAALPLAGVGCAVRTAMLARIAEARGGQPFDAESLTEDYELGLMIGALGGTGVFVQVAEHPAGPPVAVRAFFPATLPAAVRQKSRWMIGIALAGWDRTGWRRGLHLGDHWMRMRDRRAILAVPILLAAYVALVAWGVSRVGHALLGTAPAPLSPEVQALLIVNAVLLAWRLAVRASFVQQLYGWHEALWSVPRAPVANLIALLAARRAFVRYWQMLRGAGIQWDKTAHRFPDLGRDLPL